MSDGSPEWASFRPEILGSVAAEHDGDAYTMAIYFTTEAEAREARPRSCCRSCRRRWRR